MERHERLSSENEFLRELVEETCVEFLAVAEDVFGAKEDEATLGEE